MGLFIFLEFELEILLNRFYIFPDIVVLNKLEYWSIGVMVFKISFPILQQASKKNQR